MSIFKAIGAFFAKVFKFVKTDAAKVAIAVTEGVKTALLDGVLGFVAEIVDGLTKSQVPTEIVALIQANIYKILAVELAIQGLPDSPTEADILAFEQDVLTAFGVVSDKSKLYTVLASQIYGIIKAQVDAGTKLTFAQLVVDVEQAYADYLADQATDNSSN